MFSSTEIKNVIIFLGSIFIFSLLKLPTLTISSCQLQRDILDLSLEEGKFVLIERKNLQETKNQLLCQTTAFEYQQFDKQMVKFTYLSPPKLIFKYRECFCIFVLKVQLLTTDWFQPSLDKVNNICVFIKICCQILSFSYSLFRMWENRGCENL